MENMLTLSASAQNHFRRLLEQQGIDGLGVRMQAVQPGTPTADCRLEFCEAADLRGDESQLALEGFTLYIDAASVPYLSGAEIDYQANSTGGQLTVRAPKLKGTPPAEDAPLAEHVRYLLHSEINPQIASHGGRVTLENVSDSGVVTLRFGGGCHGCGMVDVTLKQGIEKTLRARLPQITQVRDATDHASGSNPYYRDHHGSTAVR
jgi:Fe/S biogenesis protein NfuA